MCIYIYIKFISIHGVYQGCYVWQVIARAGKEVTDRIKRPGEIADGHQLHWETQDTRNKKNEVTVKVPVFKKKKKTSNLSMYGWSLEQVAWNMFGTWDIKLCKETEDDDVDMSWVNNKSRGFRQPSIYLPIYLSIYMRVYIYIYMHRWYTTMIGWAIWLVGGWAINW